MPVPTSIDDLSINAIENSPQGTEPAKGTIDDYFRQHASFIAQLRDGQQFRQTVSAPVVAVHDVLRETVTPQRFGAIGTADDTAVIQAAIDTLPTGGTIDGLGKTYIVSSLNLKSNMGFENFRLATKAGSVDGVSPVTIDGRTVAKTNIRVRRVYVDGKRAQQTNIVGTFGEDGARHGFRILGSVSNLLMDDFEAINCASDGVEMYSAGASISDAAFAFSNITLRNFKCNGNRRHGLSFDSMTGVTIENFEINGNGLDLNTTDDVLHGNRGARVANSLANPCYGSAIDFEGYGVGSCIVGLHTRNGQALGNARTAFVFYDTVSQAASGFAVRRDIWISDCTLDYGIDASSDGNAISFSPMIANKALGALYRNVYLSNNKLIGGIQARAVDRLAIRGGEVSQNRSAYFAALDYATAIEIAVGTTGTGKQVYAENSSYTVEKVGAVFPAAPTLAFNAGTTGTLANIVYTPREDRRNGTYTYFVTADWTPSAGGTTVLSVAPAAGGSIVDPALVGIIDNNTGGPVLGGHNPVSGFIRFTNVGSGVVHKLQILVAVQQ